MKPAFSGSEAAAFRATLLGWFQRNARQLPWRGAKSAYEIWVSEIMLQQTRIAPTIPYYQRFISEFPTVERLAAAPLERVLELWSGLGYYRRARHLHQAARKLASDYGGRFPEDFAQARALPGVGDYTARAVLSIAYHQPYAVLDGNVARVMARLLAKRGSLAQPPFRRAVETNLALLLSRRSPGNFGQALMELGQRLCLPRAPVCPACPVRPWCRAFQTGKPGSFPQPRPHRQAENWHLAAAVVRNQERVLLVRGLEDGLLDDLWNFPSALGKSNAEALAGLKDKLHATLGDAIELKNSGHQLRHHITYRSLRVQAYTGAWCGRPPAKHVRWFPAVDIERSAVSQLARKIARKIG